MKTAFWGKKSVIKKATKGMIIIVLLTFGSGGKSHNSGCGSLPNIEWKKKVSGSAVEAAQHITI